MYLRGLLLILIASVFNTHTAVAGYLDESTWVRFGGWKCLTYNKAGDFYEDADFPNYIFSFAETLKFSNNRFETYLDWVDCDRSNVLQYLGNYKTRFVKGKPYHDASINFQLSSANICNYGPEFLRKTGVNDSIDLTFRKVLDPSGRIFLKMRTYLRNFPQIAAAMEALNPVLHKNNMSCNTETSLVEFTFMKVPNKK